MGSVKHRYIALRLLADKVAPAPLIRAAVRQCGGEFALSKLDTLEVAEHFVALQVAIVRVNREGYPAVNEALKQILLSAGDAPPFKVITASGILNKARRRVLAAVAQQ